ncbi:MAG: diacylglycerol kinase family lipid kinase [Clostridia bacterium]|nr:diacylglycerol kinase family lipid kinase [Clostridia bacterium]
MIAIICNPVSGNAEKTRRICGEVGRILSQRGLDYQVIYSDGPGRASSLTAEAVGNGCDTVIAMGGDGTVSEIAGALAGKDAAMAIIPTGTGNDYCKTLKIPLDPMKALEVFMREPARRTDAGMINGRIFVNEIGTGFDVDVLRRSEGYRKHMNGLLPYLLGVLSALIHYKTYRVTLKTDSGTELEEELTVFSVALGKIIGGGIPIAPKAIPYDGLFDVSGVRRIKKSKLPLRLLGLMKGKILDFPETFSLRAKSVVFRAPGMFVNVDGEILEMEKAEVSILPGALRIHRPAGDEEA